METPDLDTETYETIPWAQLAPAQPTLPNRIAMGVGGVVVAVALGFLLFSLLRDDAPRTMVTVPLENAAGRVAPPTASGPPPEPAAATDPVRLYSEADLMAVIPEEDQRAAAGRAVWFVTDFFTVDGDTATVASVRSMLPVGLEVPLPHDDARSVSYVEWAEAVAVRPAGPGRYLVDVAFRTLDGLEDGEIRRRAVRAVRVQIGVDDTGSVSVLDLPEPIEPAMATVAFSPPPEAEPPHEILAAAHEAAAPFGTDIETIAAGIDADGWRIALLVTDASGLDFPLVVRPGS
jgi:hypothetical protein